MVTRKVHRDVQGIESLNLNASLSALTDAGAGLHDAVRLEEFIERVRRTVESSLTVDSRLHGLRVQAMFRAVLVALGGFALLTDEDAGEPYYDDRAGEVRPPDFRVVDRDGAQLLIEVKNVSPARPLAPYRLRAADVEALRRYGELMSVPVSVALYWSAWNRWTLVEFDYLAPQGRTYDIDLPTAMKANLLSRFGDGFIGTRPPLTLTFHTTQVGASSGQAAETDVRIEDVSLSAADVELVSEQERAMAWFLLRFGDWQVESTYARGEDGRVERVEISASPPGRSFRRSSGRASRW